MKCVNFTTNVSLSFNASAEAEDFCVQKKTPLAVLYFIFGFVSVFGNVILILSMSKAGLLSLGGYRILMHYAITDVISGLLGLLYVPWAIAYHRSFGLNYTMGFVFVFGEFSRKIFIIFMAMTKFFSIMSPLSARRLLRKSRYTKLICVTWLASVFVCLPLLITQSVHFDLGTDHWMFKREPAWLPVYGVFINASTTAIILITYPLCLVKLLKRYRSWKSSLSVSRDERGSFRRSYARYCRTGSSMFKERKLFYLFLLNSFVYIIYWVPVYVVVIQRMDVDDFAFYSEITRGVYIGYNPFVYVCINSNIRRAIKRFLRIDRDAIN